MSQHRALSARQESRLVVYLDNAMLQIQRGYQKRNEASAQLPTLAAFLQQWVPLVEIISTTPLLGATAALRDTYLLRLTTELTEGVVGYSTKSDSEHTAKAQLLHVLYWADLLDQLWAARLQRVPQRLSDAQKSAKTRFPTLDMESESMRIDAESVRPPPIVHGAVDEQIPPYAQTDRVRLRDVLSQAEQQLFGWMRNELGVPQPPEQEEWGGELNEPGEAPEWGEDGAESVPEESDEIKEDTAENTEGEDTPEAATAADREHEHYADVFSKKLDPDEEEDEENEDDPPRKRARHAEPPSVSQEDLAYWDMQFARSFGRSLQDLRIESS
ncbi:uncharacterized protein MJAP1_000276 [Malassezia japonica]|uniref:Uncharacterized protein n=1 Tax=Malassezia japonica TaxID=223818 RepID=A0AAF0J851_9BASI|nr:uncharacterized protein MJAP1_000276 [Malassezia japonica]WFD37332.1 hypothetical protein MJAP1_000276 [Malassezia japonica]